MADTRDPSAKQTALPFAAFIIILALLFMLVLWVMGLVSFPS